MIAALALLLASTPDAAAAPAEPKSTPNGPDSDTADPNAVIARAGLEIDTSAAGPAGPVLLSRLEELGNLELRRAEILPRRTGEDPVIRIRVAIREDGYTYTIFSELTVDGATLEGSPREVVCAVCTESEAVERARSELLRLVPFVRARFRRKLVVIAADPNGAFDPDAPDPYAIRPHRQARAQSPRTGATGKLGIGLLAGGALAFGTGLGLALAEPRPDPDDPLRQITLHPAGYAVLAVGAAAIVSGAVLLILDRRQSRRQASLAPLLHPATTGLQFIARF